MVSDVALAAYLLAGASVGAPAFLWGRHEGRLDVLRDPDEFIDGVTNR